MTIVSCLHGIHKQNKTYELANFNFRRPLKYYGEEGTEGARVELVEFESSCQGKLRPSAEIDIYPIHPPQPIVLTIKVQKHDSGSNIIFSKVRCPKPNWKIGFDALQTKFTAKL